jgi:hypothetical protein
MDLIIGQVLSQREVDCINKSVWEIVKCIGSSLEAEDDDSNNDFFYMPPRSPSKLISTKLENCLDVDHGRRCSCILSDYHLKICHQVLYHETILVALFTKFHIEIGGKGLL